MGLSRRDLLTASALLLAGPGMALRAAGRESVAQGLDNPIVLCWNENPYGPSPAARAAVSAAITASCRYPDDELEPLVKLLATREGVSTDQIVTGTGSGELLRALGMLAAREHGEIIAAEPTYLELTRYAEGCGATIRFVPVDKRLRHDLAAMHAAIGSSTRAVYICNPNNPTGTTLPAADIRAFVAALPPAVTTIVDEAYMAGIRFGYATARADVARELEAARMTTPNVFAVRAARASLGDQSFLTDCRRRILASRTRITTELTRLRLNYAEPQGNFVFFDTGMPLKRFTELMRARNILVGRRFAPYESWCRITIGTEPEIDAFLAALPAVTGRA
jgi:histidinol-phosphate aminotransferase